jgi:ribose/xylose/arabinose/galactoside ABC-type transport system permease subunit
VRFIDVVPTVPVVAAIGMALGALAFLGARRPGRHPVLATLGCISLALSVLLVLAVGSAIFSNLGAQYDNSCWTF